MKTNKKNKLLSELERDFSLLLTRALELGYDWKTIEFFRGAMTAELAALKAESKD